MGIPSTPPLYGYGGAIKTRIHIKEDSHTNPRTHESDQKEVELRFSRGRPRRAWLRLLAESHVLGRKAARPALDSVANRPSRRKPGTGTVDEAIAEVIKAAPYRALSQICDEHTTS